MSVKLYSGVKSYSGIDMMKGEFNFSAFSGHFAEYDADLGITLGTGSSVSGWADQSASGYDLAEASGTLQPTRITGDSNFNGHDSVSGDGTERLTANIGTEVDGDDPDLTVYMVLRWNVSTAHAFKRAAGFWRSTSAKLTPGASSTT